MRLARLFMAATVACGLLASCADAEDPHDPDCIMGVAIDFVSGIEVQSEGDARGAFEAFVVDAQARSDPIFSDAYGNDWRFGGAAIDRTFEGVLYWEIDASRRSPEDGRWRAKTCSMWARTATS